ncbi:unnamed protein product [Brassica oleracea var. botrytis]
MTKARAFTILTRATSYPSTLSTFTSSPLPPSTSSRKSPSKSVDLGERISLSTQEPVTSAGP